MLSSVWLHKNQRKRGSHGDAAKKADDYITDIRKAMDLQRGAMDAEMLLYGTKVNEDTGTPGEIELDIGGKSQIPIELVVGEQGAYRAAFFLDCEPFAVFDEKSVLDFEVQENQMLSFELPLKELIPAGTHTLFALVTRMDEKVYSYARTLPTSKWKIKN